MDLSSKVTWCIDPRYSTYLNQYGRVVQLTQQHHPNLEEQKTIMQNWKSSWESKVLGPSSVKSQLKSVLFSQQHVEKLEIFLDNLCKVLHERAADSLV